MYWFPKPPQEYQQKEHVQSRCACDHFAAEACDKDIRSGMQGSVSTETSVADPVRHLVQGPFFTSARAWQAQSAMPLERCCAVPECYCLDLVGFPPCRFGRVHAY